MTKWSTKIRIPISILKRLWDNRDKCKLNLQAREPKAFRNNMIGRNRQGHRIYHRSHKLLYSELSSVENYMLHLTKMQIWSIICNLNFQMLTHIAIFLLRQGVGACKKFKVNQVINLSSILIWTSRKAAFTTRALTYQAL